MVLKDTTLLMMVRDEIINPAGGIYPLLTMQAPLYEQVIVVDTGSRDGTYELLKQLQHKLSFALYQIPFRGFSETRKQCKSYVNTTYCMVLDADELILPNSVGYLERILDENRDVAGFKIPIIDVVSGFGEIRGQGSWNPRLHKTSHVKHKDIAGKEYLQVDGEVMDAVGGKLLHFKPQIIHSTSDKQRRMAGMEKSGQYTGYSEVMPWKLPDPALLEKYGISCQETKTKLEEMGISQARKGFI
jgi:hypothetical protein